MAKIMYTSDIHGNLEQYEKLVHQAEKTKADFVVIGGDILPKGFSSDIYIKKQRQFIENKFPKIFAKLKKKLPKTRVFLMMGNDDCSVNLDALRKNEGELYETIHNRRIKLTKKLDIVGYSFVPITPFGIKDWEKYDLSNYGKFEKEYFQRKSTNYNLSGSKSAVDGWKGFRFFPEAEIKDSIQLDLSRKLFTENAEKTIYVIHCPPDNTHLDITNIDMHVGSFAIREFIEKYPPFLTLHGHIHETVEKSGHFKQHIGKTLCLSSGNHNAGNLAYLLIDLDNPEKSERIVI